MLTMTVNTSTRVGLFRALIGKTPYTDQELDRLIAHVGDVDLTFTAWSMSPRPAWMHDVATGKVPS